MAVQPIRIERPHAWSWELAPPYDLVFATGTAVVHFGGNSGFGGDELQIPITWLDFSSDYPVNVAPSASLAAVAADYTDFGAWAVDYVYYSTYQSSGVRQIMLRAYIAARPAQGNLLRVAFQANINGVRILPGTTEERPPGGQVTLPEVLEDLPTIEESDFEAPSIGG